MSTIQNERRKEKAKQRRIGKTQKLQQNNTKYAGRDLEKIRSQITQLESLSDLKAHQQKRLDTLHQQVEHVSRAKARLNPHTTADTSIVGGKNQNANSMSIYYDAWLNPSGSPPPGFPAQDWQDQGEEEDSGYETSDSVSQIPMPPSPSDAPKSKVTYESGEQLRDFVHENTKMLPSVIAKRRRQAER